LDFLHGRFFPRCEFARHYSKPSKTFLFFRTLEFVGLQKGPDGLRPSMLKRETILRYPTPSSQAEVETFLYWTSFLRRFIPGRTELARLMKGDTSAESFEWTPQNNKAFAAMKEAIANYAMSGGNPRAQYHLACDTSKFATGGVLFQLHGIPTGTDATNSEEHQEAEQIIMFMSFRMTTAEQNYTTTEREALAIVRNLAEVKWMVTASPYPIKIYTDQTALKTLLGSLDNDAHERIARWQDRLGDYDYELIHRNVTVHFMGIADGMSRLPTRCQSRVFVEDTERMEAVVAQVLPMIVQSGREVWPSPDARRAWAYRTLVAAARLEHTEEGADEGMVEVEDERTNGEEARLDILAENWKDCLAGKEYRLLILYKLAGELGWKREDLRRHEKRKGIRGPGASKSSGSLGMYPISASNGDIPIALCLAAL